MKIRTLLNLVLITLVLGAFSWWMGQQAYGWLPPQAAESAILVDQLFSLLTAIATFVVVGVVGTMTYTVLFKRAGKYDFSDGPHIEGNVTLEVVWTAIPFLTVLFIAFYSYQIYQDIGLEGPGHNHSLGMATAEAAAITSDEVPPTQIQVLSRQWAWEFRYPEANVSSTELHLPNNQRIELTLQSEDVIHGLYIPAFRLKQDIIPNREMSIELTPIQEGRFRLRDSEYSGTYFAAMQTDVVVESPEAFQKWLDHAAQISPQPAYNQAFSEFQKATEKPLGTGWATLKPAEPPVVNVASPPPAKTPAS
ncbi:MAG: cytochrome c oxidase subunit II [Cyanobacteria bacterium P01_H01_bin.15]